MGIFSRVFKKTVKRNPQVELTPSQEIQQALANNGIVADIDDIKNEFNRLWKTINFNQVLPEALSYSNSAEMELDGSNYQVYASMLVSDIKLLMSVAVYWAVASEIAKARGESKFSLKEGERIAICDFSGFHSHPIYELFPDILKLKLN